MVKSWGQWLCMFPIPYGPIDQSRKPRAGGSPRWVKMMPGYWNVTFSLNEKVHVVMLNLNLFYRNSSLNRSKLEASFCALGKRPLMPTSFCNPLAANTERAARYLIEGCDAASPTSSRFVDKKWNFLLNHLVTLFFSSMHWSKPSLFFTSASKWTQWYQKKVVAAKAKNFLKILTPKDGVYCTLYTFCGIGPPVFPDFPGSSKIGWSQWKAIHT